MGDAPSSFVVTVYASSSSGVSDSFKSAAYELGRAVADEGWVQRNGGGRYGLMGAATEGGRAAGGPIDCVILDMFVGPNMYDGAFRNVVVSSSMPARKKGLYDDCNAFVCLPGGLGTMEEVTEVMSWQQLGWHSNPIVFLNTNNFYTHFRNFYENAITESMVSSDCNKGVFFVDTVPEAIACIKNFKEFTMDKTKIHKGNMKADWIVTPASDSKPE